MEPSGRLDHAMVGIASIIARNGPSDGLMLASDVVEVVRQVAAADPATCDTTELRSLAEGAHRVRCWLERAHLVGADGTDPA